MNISFEGVGQVCATFLGSGLTDGQVVKMTDNCTVGACGADDSFCGVAMCCKDDACTVQVSGFVSVSYTGTAPTLGWCGLAADGKGGVKKTANDGVARLVTDVDTTAKIVTIML